MRNSSALAPVFVGLRMAVHIVFVGLVVFVMLRAGTMSTHPALAIGIGAALILLYLVGSFRAHFRPNMALRRGGLAIAWLLLLTGLWVALAAVTPDAAFIVLPLFVLYLELLDALWSIVAVVVTTVISILLLSAHIGFSIGGLLGPLLGAAIAVIVGLGYRSLTREADERQRLINELVATRAELALTEREAGRMSERDRLARDIHDTIAQALSSIQLLLHAVERNRLEDADQRTLDQLRLARETAADALLETRRIIGELTPPALDDRTLTAALQRLVESTQEQLRALPESADAVVVFERRGTPRALAMSVETTLLRIAQGMTANVVRHSGASSARLVLSFGPDSVGLDMIDDGRGFEIESAAREAESNGSFGLFAIQQRVTSLGGTLSVDSTRGHGTTVSVAIPAPVDAARTPA